jgi:uncharacterized protein
VKKTGAKTVALLVVQKIGPDIFYVLTGIPEDILRHTKFIVLIALLTLVPTFISAQVADPQIFTRMEAMIPMRDGVKLQTVIFVPKEAKEALPIILTRTPYGVPQDEKPVVHPRNAALIADGYIFVVQNIRGRFKSEGAFVMQRPPRDKNVPNSIDETTDAYDTVAWLLKNVPNNNGRVGLTGGSYSAWTAMMALMEPHPAVKAAIEAASPADMFLGDDFHHNGAFRLSYGFEYAALLESEKEENHHFEFDKLDTYEWYLDLGPLSNANARYFHGKIPTWNDFVAHPNLDGFWEKQILSHEINHTDVPLLNVAGWWDQEDFYGPQKIYELLESSDTEHRNYFVAGPWNHGGWAWEGDSLGPIAFDSKTGEHYQQKIVAPWFRYWLHGKGEIPVQEATVFETGSNQWKSYPAWPPKTDIQTRKIYFHADRKLSFEKPTASADAFDAYVSDPANPVPYQPRPVMPTYPGPEWPVWLVQDQRFVDHRPDVLSWQSDVLTEDMAVAGDIVADIFASTSGSDSDWIVKLIDVYPEGYKPSAEQAKLTKKDLSGYQLIIADEVFRGRFHNSFEKPEPLPPDQALEYKIDLHTNDHVFQKGHRIMVQVQSTWFPLIDRNPQTFVPNIFAAKATDYVKAMQKIYRSAEQPSGILLPVLVKR